MNAKNEKMRANPEYKKLSHKMVWTPPLTEQGWGCSGSESVLVKDARDALYELGRQTAGSASDG